MTITYTNQYYTILGHLRDLFTSEFGTELTVLIGDRTHLINFPCIILEPYDKTIDQSKTYGKKDYEFTINIWVFHSTVDEEQAVKSISETVERIEELLIDNVENPASDGSKWYISSPEKSEYGMTSRAGNFLRTCKIIWNFKKRLNK